MPVDGSRWMRHTSFMNIAHRGASAYAPENTLAAFDKALKFDGERIPTLGELLERYKGKLHFHVEVKGRAVRTLTINPFWCNRSTSCSSRESAWGQISASPIRRASLTIDSSTSRASQPAGISGAYDRASSKRSFWKDVGHRRENYR